ncbi:MAG: hypothetical protein CO064_11365 [Anaerolineae bacterium CG_4_9_14_0_8_um_filter_58_9]|nr:MAG: hypothetical protein CO064_11365 [Anaerolineae bacterium CG_4_9_14_0_8_um_filter_58_9]
MKPVRRRRLNKLWIFLALIFLSLGSIALYYIGRPLPIPVRQQLFDGIIYYRRVHFLPRLFIAHIITVDLQTPGLQFLVTPGDPQAERPLEARTTSKFMSEFGAQVAVNGDGFTPWHSNSLLDYYPHPGDPVTPNGAAASQGVVYATGTESTLYISAENVVSFTAPESGIYNAISGDRILVENGAPVAGQDDGIAAPRTAIGLDGGGQKLIIVVIDGRQPLYSQGATLGELAEIMLYYGAETAMNLDGGGSSTLVVQGPNGPRVLNSPIDLSIPGRERAVGNHLGIFVNP